MSKKNSKTGNSQKNEVKVSGFKKLLTANSIGTLILRIVILLVIPYAYLMLCGYVFERVLHMYTSFASNFTFFSLIVLFVAALVLIVLCIVWYVQSQKKKSK